MDDITQLESYEQTIKSLTEQLNEAINLEAHAKINLINTSTKVLAIKNSLKQVEGIRDSLKKILTIKPQ